MPRQQEQHDFVGPARLASGSKSFPGRVPKQELGNELNELNEPAPSRSKRLKARRKLWLKVHLWLGLIVGAVLVLIGLTGSVLAFWQEIDAWLNPALYAVEHSPGVAPLPVAALAEAARSALPHGAPVGWVAFPGDDAEALNLFYPVPSASVAGGMDTRQLFIDPYTGLINGSRLWYPADWFAGMPIMALLFKLHYALLMKEHGVGLVGICGALLIVAVLSGLILWWPLTGKWRQAVTIKRGASRERLAFDLHKTAGFYTALVMLVLLLSGVCLSLPEYVNPLLESFSALHLPERVHSGPSRGRAPIGWGRAAEIVETRYPEGRLLWLVPPRDAAGVYNVCKHDIASLNRFVGQRCALVDQYSGEVLRVLDQAAGSAGDVFLQWQWPLHSGKAFGLTGRLLVFIAGLACPVLYVTGLIRWLQKRRGRA